MIDRLMYSIEKLKAPIVVGLDPTSNVVPEEFYWEAVSDFGETPEACAVALLKFNLEIIDAVADIVPAVKPNIAFYERYGSDGIRAYIMTAEYAASRGLVVIGDVKRGDIGSTAEAYTGHIESVAIFRQKHNVWSEDAVTLNPYLGEDSITPFLEVLKTQDKGIFTLVKTSNPGSADIQDLLVNVDSKTIPLYEHVASKVSNWGSGDGLIGEYGYSKVGAVVGATYPEIGVKLRELMPHTFFLVPGYGAQGAGAKDVRGCFDSQGKGAIVNSSRGILGAWKAEGKSFHHVGECAREAAIRMRDDLGAVL